MAGSRFALIAALLILFGGAEGLAAEPVLVTPDNFARAETDMYFATSVRDAGLGKLEHRREPFDVQNQTVIRGNRDTLYSSGVFDLDAGPVTVTMPEAGARFMSLMVLNEDHYVAGIFHGAGKHTFSKDDIGTRYVMLAFRTLVDPNKPEDVKEVHRLQDEIAIEQNGGPGVFEVPNWDKPSQDKVRDALLTLGSTLSGFQGAFGSKDQVDPVHHLIGAAAGWGGNPDSEATYIGVTPAKNDGSTVYKLHVPADVPVDGFWSISRYNAKGYFTPNDLNAYSLNNITAAKTPDGSVNVQFGGCDRKVPNCLPIEAGWNYTVRLYQPRAEILDGIWKFPEPVAAPAS